MSHNKNTQAMESIQELSASLFYKKLRDETEMQLPSKKDLGCDKNCATKGNFTTEENLAHNMTDGGKEIISSQNNLANNFSLAKFSSLVDASTSEENLASEKLLAKLFWLEIISLPPSVILCAKFSSVVKLPLVAQFLSQPKSFLLGSCISVSSRNFL
jgi:hypothetical protein